MTAAAAAGSGDTHPHSAEPVFLDTSAIYAVFDADDSNHARAAGAWTALISSDAVLHTTNYVLVELIALLQNRLGSQAVELLHEFVLPWVGVVWVDQALHREGQLAFRTARRRDLSLVDCVSFVTMRSVGIRRSFTVDSHFAEQGFETLPSPA